MPGPNSPAQIHFYAVDGDEYKFLCIAKGGGSANKTYLYQETSVSPMLGKLNTYLLRRCARRVRRPAPLIILRS
ncbi:fumarate hydratase [Shigella flexneri]